MISHSNLLGQLTLQGIRPYFFYSKYNGEITCRPTCCPPFKNEAISGQVY